MGMILRIASSRIVGQGDIVGRSGYFSLNLSANSVMRGRLDARRTLKSLVADLRVISISVSLIGQIRVLYQVLLLTTIITDVLSNSKKKWIESVLFKIEVHLSEMHTYMPTNVDFFS